MGVADEGCVGEGGGVVGSAEDDSCVGPEEETIPLGRPMSVEEGATESENGDGDDIVATSTGADGFPVTDDAKSSEDGDGSNGKDSDMLSVKEDELQEDQMRHS